MKRTFLILTLLAGVCYAQPVPVIDPLTQPLDAWCPVAVHRVLDADSVVGDVHLPFDVALTNQTLRVDTYDAWETSKRRNSEAAGEITDDEVLKGKAAKAEFEKLLEDGTLYVKPGIRCRDNYGRLLGSWRIVSGFKVIEMAEYAKKNKWLRTKAGK